ncbi:MAG: thiamine phosphate synthase [Planctomycetes bacterium]|nr:thiamine phosphate synthase [Planctomycetota bacterium]
MNRRQSAFSSGEPSNHSGSSARGALQARFRQSRLYVLVDGQRDETEFERIVLQLVAAGVDVLQLRDKHLSDRQLIARARLLRRLTRDSATLFVVNDRPDLALLADADGVHVGQDELTVEDARRVIGCDRVVGVSTHSVEQARRAVLDGADYIGCGPTFSSQTKSFDRFTGLSLLRRVAGESPLPAFAIGGIDLENLPAVLETGIGRIAVSAAIVKSPDPQAAARRILAIMESWK